MIEKILNHSFVKFLGVGVINTIIGTSIMFVFYNVFHFNYWISSASNYIVGGIISYFLNKNFTFKYGSGNLYVMIKFAVNVAVCYFIAYGVAKPLLVHILAGYSPVIQENVAMVAGMGFYVILNYLGQRFFAFRKSVKEEDK